MGSTPLLASPLKFCPSQKHNDEESPAGPPPCSVLGIPWFPIDQKHSIQQMWEKQCETSGDWLMLVGDSRRVQNPLRIAKKNIFKKLSKPYLAIFFWVFWEVFLFLDLCYITTLFCKLIYPFFTLFFYFFHLIDALWPEENMNKWAVVNFNPHSSKMLFSKMIFFHFTVFLVLLSVLTFDKSIRKNGVLT